MHFTQDVNDNGGVFVSLLASRPYLKIKYKWLDYANLRFVKENADSLYANTNNTLHFSFPQE